MTVSFFGHRDVQLDESGRCKLRGVIEGLIAEGADKFLFGSKSEFDRLCWEVVTDLMGTYAHIKRIGYIVPHEYAYTSKTERESDERIMAELYGREERLCDFEEVVRCEVGYKSAYVVRNRAMADNSDVCVFYYDGCYAAGSKSGTALIYAYAQKNNKRIINVS